MYLCDMDYAAIFLISHITHYYSAKCNFFIFCYIYIVHLTFRASYA